MMLLRQILLTIAGLLLTIVLAGCDLNRAGDEESEPFERRKLPRTLSDAELQIVDGSGAFGFDLMHRLIDASPDRNHFISPLSILMAYGMTMNGAEGETYSQMQEAFGLEGMSRTQINRSALELMELLVRFDEDVRFNIANSIWYRNTFEVEKEFLETNRHYYEAADFNDPETVDRINGWVSDKTEGRIEEIVKGPIDPLTVMYLINAIYFNGDWTVQFDPDKTESRPFQLPDQSTIDTEMMRLEEREQMLYADGEDYQAVNLYYGDAGFAMTLVLPDEETGLANWLNELDWNKWQELSRQPLGFREVTLTLEMPKFEMEYEIEKFKGVLQEMDIVDAFNPYLSDFSRINRALGDSLYISDTRHKTFIRVNEEGTEATAATSVEVSFVSVPKTVEITFARPFFYVIREVESGTILFMGTMTDPSS